MSIRKTLIAGLALAVAVGVLAAAGVASATFVNPGSQPGTDNLAQFRQDEAEKPKPHAMKRHRKHRKAKRREAVAADAEVRICTARRASAWMLGTSEGLPLGVAAELDSAALLPSNAWGGHAVIVTWRVRGAGLIRADTRSRGGERVPPNALGVSRTAEIDTTGGPWFGSPRGDKDFLAPGEVVLTFDDGRHQKTRARSSPHLAAHCTKATFFMLGEMARNIPASSKRSPRSATRSGRIRGRIQPQAAVEEQAQRTDRERVHGHREGGGATIAPFFRYPY
jgi:hypothetical protein